MSLDRINAMLWSRVPELVDEWSEKSAAPAWDIKKTTSLIFTQGDIGFYWNPIQEKAAMFCRRFPTKQDVALCKMALDRAVGTDSVVGDPLPLSEVTTGGWVKVAYSPLLRRTGEALNFLPGKYPNGYPNAPSPLAATLTSGLVGAGLGYGAGAIGEKLLPESWQKGKLKRTLALLGGAAGAAPGAAWMYSANARGRDMQDGSDVTDYRMLDSMELPDTLSAEALQKGAEDIILSSRYTNAVSNFVKQAYGDTFAGEHHRRPPTAIDVNINKLGQTLWEVGASPQATATTMGALYAAQQLPDRRSRPNWVTAHQTGLLGSMMGAAGGGLKGYAAGYMVGKAMNVLTGAPVGLQNTLKHSGAALGIINTVVPRLFD